MNEVIVNVTIELEGEDDVVERAEWLVWGMPEFFQAMVAERAAQDKQWGGPTHDDTHAPRVWEELLHQHAARLTHAGDLVAPDYRRRLVKIATIAVAAARAWDRARTPGESGEVINDIDAELTKVEAMASALGAEVGMEPVQSYATQTGTAVIQRRGGDQ